MNQVDIDFDKLSMKSKLDVYYTSCKASEDFSNNFVKLFPGILRPTVKEKILIDIYRSVHCWLKTVVALNNAVHFQALASAARSVFEQVLDARLIADNKIENAVNKFEAYREIEKFRMAKQILEFKHKYPNVKMFPHLKRLQLASNETEKLKVDRLRLLWGKRDSMSLHWSGLALKDRAEIAGVGYYLRYCESYTLLSWYIHSGQVGTRMMSKEGLELIYGDSMRIIHEMFVDLVSLVAIDLKLETAIPGFKDLVQNLKLIPGFAILEVTKQHLQEQENHNT